MSGSTSGSKRLPCFAIVRRGETGLFRTLKAELEEPNLVEVVWDRRIGERRTGIAPRVPDRRQQERRGPPPEMWDTLGFAVAPQGGGDQSG